MSKKSTADGLSPELDPFAYRGGPAAGITTAPGADNRIKGAIAAPPTLGAAPFSRSEPDGALTNLVAGGITIGPFGSKPEPGGSGQTGIGPRAAPGLAASKVGRDASGIITAESAQAAAGSEMQRSGGVFGTIDLKGGNEILARENKARGEMIDLSIKANGGNGVAVLPDYQPPQQGGISISDIQSAMKSAGTRTERAAYGQMLNTVLNNQVQQRGQDLSHAAEIGRQGITVRGQDIVANTDAQRIGLDRSRLDLSAQSHRDDNQLSAIRTGLDVERFGLEKQAAQRQQAASDALVQATASGDPAKISQARQAAVSAGLKVEPAPNLQHVETERGTMVFDPRTGRMTPAIGSDGQPVGSGKALTEYQGKSTGFGMRAQEASRIIDQVGQGGKVQPSLLKRTAESVPLIGEGLGLAANALQSPEQQQVEQATRDFLNAVLRQESGAVISDAEFANARKQYFPQPGDSAEVVAQKQRNREAAINGFRISAGPGAKNIGGAAPAQTQPAATAPQAQGQQPAGAPKVGMVDGKHVFIGGNPADPASWAEVR